MSAYDYDLFVIGAGSGGVRASRVAAGHGAKVVVCENYRVGGTCVIRGCIPKKLLTYAAHYAEDFEDAEAYGWTVGPRSFSWPKLIANKDNEIDRLNGIYIRLLDDAGVEIIEGTGRLVDLHNVDIDGRQVTAETILVATGGSPTMPDVPGVEHAVSSNEVFHLEEQPRRVVVVGGGYIACEFAGIFNGLGSEVVQLYRGAQILRGFDDDVRNTLAQEARKKGVDVRVEANVSRIDQAGSHFEVVCATGTVIETDLVLYATGRAPNTKGLGLEEVGVKLKEGGAVSVDEWSRSSVANIYAVGDVTDRLNLTPVALNEGLAFAETVFGGNDRKMDHRTVAYAVFSQPNISCVGLSEADARAEYGDVDIYKSTFGALKHTLTGRQEMTMMKIVVDAASQRILGLHMVGPEAAEIIQGLAVAVKMGATKAQLDATIGIHPTAAEEFVTMRRKFVQATAKAAE